MYRVASLHVSIGGRSGLSLSCGRRGSGEHTNSPSLSQPFPCSGGYSGRLGKWIRSEDDRVQTICHGTDLKVMVIGVAGEPICLRNRIRLSVGLQMHSVMWNGPL